MHIVDCDPAAESASNRSGNPVSQPVYAGPEEKQNQHYGRDCSQLRARIAETSENSLHNPERTGPARPVEEVNDDVRHESQSIACAAP